MAIGDFVNGVMLATTFQPLGTNVVCITSASWWNTYLELTDGVNTGRCTTQLNDSTWNTSFGWNSKIFINNTNYLNFRAGGSGGDYRVYSGVQTA